MTFWVEVGEEICCGVGIRVPTGYVPRALDDIGEVVN